MAAAIYASVELTQISCGECGGTYAINEKYRTQCHDKGTGWHCPYCETAWGYYTNNRYKELEDQLKAAQSSLVKTDQQLSSERATHDQTKAELRETERRRRAEKGAKTKLKNRINAGTCPCCDQQFTDLAEHMKAQHPEFATTTENDEPTE